MPKIFSESEKLSHKQLLFDRGLALIMERGYKNVTVDELIKLTGGSKGYFYLLFESKEDFFLKAVMWQMEQMYISYKKSKLSILRSFRLLVGLFDDFLNSALCVQHNFFAVLIDCAMTLSAVILSSTIPILLYELREKF